jgi:hypothetical protein
MLALGKRVKRKVIFSRMDAADEKLRPRVSRRFYSEGLCKAGRTNLFGITWDQIGERVLR